MLRYRVAVTLLLFYLMGAAAHGGARAFRPGLIAGALALAFGYIVATCLNDISDQDIDRINHGGHRGRPLVTGEVTRGELLLIAGVCAAASLACSAVVGGRGVLVAAASAGVSVAYSTSPLRLSHRPYVASPLLSSAYVLLPYALGVLAAGAALEAADAQLAAALGLLFLGRIVLKDLRDREGDQRLGKATFLLQHGKPATCLLCLLAILSGDLLLWVGARFEPPLLLLMQGYFMAISVTLGSAWRAAPGELEQACIGIGAKLGNGLLLTILGLLVLQADRAPMTLQVMFASALLAAFLYAFAILVRQPSAAVIGYRG
jgi:4-hydroxybenzoate polyprenyltransferase